MSKIMTASEWQQEYHAGKSFTHKLIDMYADYATKHLQSEVDRLKELMATPIPSKVVDIKVSHPFQFMLITSNYLRSKLSARSKMRPSWAYLLLK